MIEDLRDPRLNAVEQGVLDRAAGRTVSFDVHRLRDDAIARTGLDDFGPDDVWVRVRQHVGAIEADEGLTAFGRLGLRRRVVGLLAQRLLLHELLHRYPEIHDIEIERPLIVVGLPRSGTTHLVNLLAADTRFRSLPFWESQEPFPGRGSGPGPDGVDPRYLRCQHQYDAGAGLLPHARAMHDRRPESIEEEVELQDLDFGSYCLEWHARVPSWRDAYLAFDHVERYAALKTVLQALTFLRGPRRWVLKSPQHFEQLRALNATFPDATIAITHRDPVAVIQSAVTMLAYTDRMRRTTVDAPELAAYWIDRVERLLRACVRDRDLIPPERSIDVPFHEFMEDDLATVARIHERAGVPDDAAEQARLTWYMDTNPRGKHGRMAYDLQGHFGVDPAEVRERFGFYFDRFPIRAEA